MATIRTSSHSDYFKIQEFDLDSMTKTFMDDSAWLLDQLETAESCLRETFQEISECEGRSRELKCCGEISCEGREVVYSDVLQDLAELTKCKLNLEDHLQFIEESKKVDEPDRELLGLNVKEQNCVLHKRIVSLEKEKSLIQKIIRKLIDEFESFQQKSVDPTVEAGVLCHLVQSRQAQVKSLEDQLNAEVRRIEKAFAEKYKMLSKPKRKYEQIDWKLRTEIQPKMVRLHNALFKGNEDLKKVNKEILELDQFLSDQASRNEKLEEESRSLERELEQWTNDFKSASREVKLLRNELKQTVANVDSAKANFSKEFTKFCEDAAIDDLIKDIFKDDLESRVDDSKEHAIKTFAAIACVTNQLEKKITCMKSLLEGSCHKREKLKTHADFLMGLDPKETLGNDYQGSKFVTFVENSKNCAN